jgi:CRISPR system Cascade subunit CasC
MLIEIHIIQNHAPANLNRDDTGSPKECMFGGARRGRVSSQCLKRSIRRSELFQEELAGHLATRTRRLPELIRERFEKDDSLREYAELAAKKVSGFGTKEGKERALEKDGKFATAQTMFLTDADVSHVFEVVSAAAREAATVKKFENLKGADLQKSAQQKGFRPISVDVALFGRMVTSEAFRDVEASTQVAHAISTHAVKHEFDYFTAVDDLARTNGEVEEDAGADMIGDVEFNSACYYKYFSIDREGFIDNLIGRVLQQEIADRDEAAAIELVGTALDALLRSAVMVSPSGKQNSFASHQLPALVLIEVRPHRSPVSYANAFVKPVSRGSDGLVASSLDAFRTHVEALTDGFSLKADSRWLLAPEFPDFGIESVNRVASLNALCEQLANCVKGATTNG